ncbi:hypothetical protein [Peribacillus butanolivorans]
MNKIKKIRAKQGDTRPITFLIMDDTQSKKDQTTRRMEGLDYHFSHSAGKSAHCKNIHPYSINFNSLEGGIVLNGSPYLNKHHS